MTSSPQWYTVREQKEGTALARVCQRRRPIKLHHAASVQQAPISPRTRTQCPEQQPPAASLMPSSGRLTCGPWAITCHHLPLLAVADAWAKCRMKSTGVCLAAWEHLVTTQRPW